MEGKKIDINTQIMLKDSQRIYWLYCEDCKTVFDFSKSDFLLSETEHYGHDIRVLTTPEYIDAFVACDVRDALRVENMIDLNRLLKRAKRNAKKKMLGGLRESNG